MTKISDVLDVSEEVLNRHVKGFIELYKVMGEGDEFEKNSKAVLNSTYPTATICRIIDFVSRKIDPTKDGYSEFFCYYRYLWQWEITRINCSLSYFQ